VTGAGQIDTQKKKGNIYILFFSSAGFIVSRSHARRGVGGSIGIIDSPQERAESSTDGVKLRRKVLLLILFFFKFFFNRPRNNTNTAAPPLTSPSHAPLERRSRTMSVVYFFFFFFHPSLW
jgi:hypothetical protein